MTLSRMVIPRAIALGVSGSLLLAACTPASDIARLSSPSAGLATVSATAKRATRARSGLAAVPGHRRECQARFGFGRRQNHFGGYCRSGRAVEQSRPAGGLCRSWPVGCRRVAGGACSQSVASSGRAGPWLGQSLMASVLEGGIAAKSSGLDHAEKPQPDCRCQVPKDAACGGRRDPARGH